jgi:DNA polymerase (family 10)
MSVRLRNGLRLDLTVVPEVSYGAMLQCYTGSKGHTKELRRRANERGLRVTDFGVFRGRERVAGRTEEDIYEAIGMPWIPPELRESRGEFDLALQGRLPTLLEFDDIRGDLHLHAPSTNGRSSLETMVEAAVKRGYAYVAVADRPKGAARSSGVDARLLHAHWQAVEKLAGRMKGIELLKGVEVEILEDGTLDLAEELLAEAEWVIACIRNGHKLPREEITGRLQSAIKNPHVHAVGGLTGRRVGESEGFDVGLDDVFRAAADYGCILELNARPDRLDPDDVALMLAKERGVRVVINTDASSVEEMGDMEFGVYRARRAGLEVRNVVNTRTLAQFRRLLER